jgi:hypothetical protein
MELKATSPAQYFVSPLVSSFHTITIAMRRPRPIMIRPAMYSGLPGEEQDGEDEHQNRTDDPVLHQGEAEDLEVAEHLAHLFVADLG